MNYTQLTEKKKVEIDILLKQGLSMRKVAEILGVHHSTISRYKSGKYKKRIIDINKKYEIFIKYLFEHYDKKTFSIEICIHKFKQYYSEAKCPSVKQVYNWINEGKIFLTKEKLCYKKKKKSKNQHDESYKMEYRSQNSITY